MTLWSLLPKLAGLMVAAALITIITGALVPIPLPPAAEAAPGIAVMALFVVGLAEVVVLWLLLRQAPARGWKVVGALWLLYFGTKVLMAQIEVWYFAPPVVPKEAPPMIVLNGALAATLLVPLVALTLGAFKKDRPAGAVAIDRRGWAWRVPTVMLLYVAVYLTFGYFVAWQSPELRAYYGADELVPFGAHLAHTVRNDPWLIPFQALRGLIWIALALPVLGWLRGSMWTRGLLVGLAFAVFMNAQHLYPNPLMPPTVRWYHFWETATSNLLFGFAAVMILIGRPGAPALQRARSEESVA